MFGSCLDGLQMCVRCYQPFVAEAASDVSDVDPNGHVVRLSSGGALLWSYGWVLLSFVVSEMDRGLLIGNHQTFGF